MQYRRLSRRVVIIWVSLELVSAALSLSGVSDWLGRQGQDSLPVRQARFEAYLRAHAATSGAPTLPAAGTSDAR